LPDKKLELLLGDAETRLNTMKEHKLRKPKSNIEINDKVGYFNLQIHLRQHFIQPEAQVVRETL
jgi:hypothetical protein